MEEKQQGDVVAFLDGLALLAVRHLSVRDMSFTSASTLSRLARCGPLRLTWLAEDEGVTKTAMTQLVQRLTKQGLLARVADPDDGRVVLVGITDEGRRTVDGRLRARAERLSRLVAALPAQDRRALAEAARIGRPALGRLMAGARTAERAAADPAPP